MGMLTETHMFDCGFRMSDSQEEIAKRIQQLLAAATTTTDTTSAVQRQHSEHKFWKTQPVPQSTTDITNVTSGPIRDDEPEKVRPNPLSLPGDFTWCTLDLATSETDLDDLHALLTAHYVEDSDSLFRFAYSKEFLRWALMPPGYVSDWHVGVKVKSTGKMVAFISGIPLQLKVREATLPMAEVNFLCVHKRLRDKRLAPVLIREVTRRVNLTGVYQAVYTAGVKIPSPIATARYFHRSLNPLKLLETQFSSLPRGMTLHKYQQRYHLPKATSTKGLRPMKEDDVDAVRELLNKELAKRCELAPVFGDEDAQHWLKPLPGVVHAWVVEDAKGTITDYISLYSLPSSVIGHPKHSELRIAYLYYYAIATPEAITDDAEQTKVRHARLSALVKDMLIMAKEQGFDVVNALHLMENESFLDELKFMPGDGYLHYYLFNWRCAPLDSSKIGLVML